MLVQARHENVGIFESQPAPVAAWAGALVRFCKTRLLELGIGALLVVLWLQVFGTWVSFLQEASLLGWPR